MNVTAQHTVRSPDGLRLAVREGGTAAGRPILFLHGVSQSQLCFDRQFADPALADHRLVSYDLRGHGESDKPVEDEFYADGRRWADDLRAVIEGLSLERPVLVGWSLGGRVIAEYLRWYGDSGVGAVNIVASAPVLDGPELRVFGPALRWLSGMSSDDLETNIFATTEFVRECTRAPLPLDRFVRAVAYNMACPAYVRRGIGSWPFIDQSDVLRTVRVPTLVTQGRQDEVSSPIAVDLLRAAMPAAQFSLYDECGHAPFEEHPVRFGLELSSLARSAVD